MIEETDEIEVIDMNERLGLWRSEWPPCLKKERRGKDVSIFLRAQKSI